MGGSEYSESGGSDVATAQFNAEVALLYVVHMARRVAVLRDRGASAENIDAAVAALVNRVKAADELVRKIPGCDFRLPSAALGGGA